MVSARRCFLAYADKMNFVFCSIRWFPPAAIALYSAHRTARCKGVNLYTQPFHANKKGGSRALTRRCVVLKTERHVLLLPLCCVWQVGYDFRAKIIYTAHIVRRVLMTVIDPTTVDDKVRHSAYSDRCSPHWACSLSELGLHLFLSSTGFLPKST